jgi:uncharacterized protein YndB with AHSA1/START domain
MAHYRFTVDVAAPPERVWDLWVDLDRMGEWVGGVTGVTDRVGTPGTTGARYVVRFGPVKSPTEVLEAERPLRIRTRFGSWILRGETLAVFEPVGDATRLTQEFQTIGRISAISAWVFSRGSYEGSFRGELQKFARLAEAGSGSG